MNLLVISTSLNPDSRSRVMAREARGQLELLGATVDFLDLQKTPLPLCDGDATYSDPAVKAVSRRVAVADGIIMAIPVYNYYASAAGKNLIELTGNSWEDKVVGFLCAAGGDSSYMSVMSLANSLMLDFRCVIVPRFVYALGSDFESDSVSSAEVRRRISELAQTVHRFAAALGKKGDPSTR